MGRAQRFGVRIGRGWMALLLAAGVLLLVGYWIGPLRPLPAQLELLAVAGDVAVPQIRAEPRRTPQGEVVFAVPLAVRNVGAQTVRPRRLVLNVPAHFRLTSERGQLKGEVSAGVPLRRYVIELPAPQLAPGIATRRLPGLDTIFLVPDLPRYYCMLQGVQVPEFTPAPRYDATTISDVRIFYSFSGTAGPERHTGVITVQLDPDLLQVTPAALPPAFPTVLEEPEATAPDLGPLSFGGARAAVCGDPEQPVQVYTVQWESRGGARMHVVFVDGEPRKRLYDMDRDGIIDLETWDASGDGRFEARREARYAIPDFLLPLPPHDPSMLEPDPVPPDSAWLALFHRHIEGPDRFASSSLTAHPPVVVVDTMQVDSRTDTTRADAVADLGPVPAETPEFLALFADTLAGPFRFSTRRDRTTQQATTQQPMPAGAQPIPALPGEPTAEATEIAPDTAAPPAPAPRGRRPPLGTPIRQ